MIIFFSKNCGVLKVMMIKKLRSYHSCLFTINDSLGLSQNIMRSNDCTSHTVLLGVETGLQETFCFPSLIFSAKCKPLLNLGTAVDRFYEGS